MIVRISRFNPSIDEKPHIEVYNVEVPTEARVLNVLDTVQTQIDSTLKYRKCCGAGQCGSCAVKVNGNPVLACTKQAHENDLIEPLDLPIICDLITDISPILSNMPHINPDLVCCNSKHDLTTDIVTEIQPLRDCIECCICISACPAIAASEYSGPTIIRQEQRLNLDPRDSSDRIAESVKLGLFKCTTCHKCVEVCPKKIEIPRKAVEKLRELAVKRGLSLPPHRLLANLIKETGRSVEKKGKSFLDIVPDIIEPDIPVRYTVGFFVGCMFNDRVIQPALDAMDVLKRNGIRVIIPKEQVCCGSPLIRTGFTEIIPKLYQRNIDAFVKSGVNIVITMCAGCGSTLKNDYKTPFRVADITEFLCEIGYDKPNKLNGVYTYHDPCHLLRGQKIHDQPRDVLKNIVNTFIDIPPHCCGAGGGVKSGNPDEALKIGNVRSEMIRNTGADYIITACPFCEFHISQVTGMPVKNIMTLLSESYKKQV
ncbi:MAG TPA: succinate dehydrogenase/fumarate reductase iron-sulfur subunit [Methanocorpusculum sp.]|nr:succinate dehydrogenase/fumarate reductase iron-sulfur subunit [Methanocorpusculum sp.]